MVSLVPVGSGTCPAAFGTTDGSGTVILTNFVPSDAATIGSGMVLSAREGGRKEGSGEGGRKEGSRSAFNLGVGAGCSICRVFTMTNDVRNLHHWH